MPNWVKSHIVISNINEENQERLISTLMVEQDYEKSFYMDFNRIIRMPACLNIRSNSGGQDGMNAIRKLIDVYEGRRSADSIKAEIDELIRREEPLTRRVEQSERPCSAPIELFNMVELLLACANQPDKSKWPEITPEYQEIFAVLKDLVDVHEDKLGILEKIPGAMLLEQKRREKAREAIQSVNIGRNVSERRVKSPVRCFAHGLREALNIALYGAPDWYDWRIENWGTKWLPQYTEWERDKTDCMLTIDMETAWSVPEPIIRALSKKYPRATFETSYADEDTGYNCGQMVYKHGQLISEEDFSETDRGISLACEVWGMDEEEYRAERGGA